MKLRNKKGFTIVELVIVIAVIAILAAVLIPTFASLVQRANQSADQQAVAQMNKLLAIGEKPADIDGAIEVLMANGYKGTLATYYEKYSLAWVKSENAIVLIENDSISYPVQYVNKGLTYEIINPMITDPIALAPALADNRVVYVGANITIDDNFTTPATGNYAMNLAGNTIKVKQYFGSYTPNGTLAVSNGIIDARETTVGGEKIAVYAQVGSVELNNVQIYAAPGANPIQCYGGTMVLDNVTATQSGSAEVEWYNSAIQIINRIDYDATPPALTGDHATVTINSGMYSGKTAIQMSAPGGTAIINGGTFVGTEKVINADYNDIYSNGPHKIEINGGTFTGAVVIAEGVTCTVNGGTFSVDIANVENVTIGDGKTVVNNGDGTWTVK